MFKNESIFIMREVRRVYTLFRFLTIKIGLTNFPPPLAERPRSARSVTFSDTDEIREFDDNDDEDVGADEEVAV